MRANVRFAIAAVAFWLVAAPVPAQIIEQSFGFVTIGPGGGLLGHASGPGSGGPGTAGQFYGWQINDAGPSITNAIAPGVAGPSANASNQTSGWRLLVANQITILGQTTSGDLTWSVTATPGSQFVITLETLLGPYATIGATTDGPMSDFDPNLPYTWPFIAYTGSYVGPTDSATLTADTLFDTSLFANPHPGTFAISLDQINKQMDVVYNPTPVPEPGTLGLVAVGALGVWRAVVRRSRP